MTAAATIWPSGGNTARQAVDCTREGKKRIRHEEHALVTTMHALLFPGLVLATHGRVVKAVTAVCCHHTRRELQCPRASDSVPSQCTRIIAVVVS